LKAKVTYNNDSDDAFETDCGTNKINANGFEELN